MASYSVSGEFPLVSSAERFTTVNVSVFMGSFCHRSGTHVVLRISREGRLPGDGQVSTIILSHRPDRRIHGSPYTGALQSLSTKSHD